MGGLINMIGSPLPALFGYGTYFTIKDTFEFLYAIFKKEETKTIIKRLSKKSFVVSIILVCTYVISRELSVGNPMLAIAGIVILTMLVITIITLDYVYKKRKAIWNFLVNH